MRILIKSMYLFLFGVYADICKYRLNSLLDRQIKHGRDISSPALVKYSNRCYNLYVEFQNLEYRLCSEISLKSLV